MTSNFGASGPKPLASYTSVLTLLAEGGGGIHAGRADDLLFVRNIQGVDKLFQTISAVNATRAGASDEEWNPLSQRPHSPLPPAIPDDGLGFEIRTLKTAIDSFTTLAHEMMHVALWEPFFTGRWRPRSRRSFMEFSLLAEGYCFFFSDIVVSGAIRERLPDGEYAMDRRTSENAFFHPSRAFKALGIVDAAEILDIYLEGFRGGQTRLWQPRGVSPYAASLAHQVYEFYEDTVLPLHDLYAALESFGGLSEFHRRFCKMRGLPTFQGDETARRKPGTDLKDYFVAFHASGLQSLEAMSLMQIERMRQRRMLQMRAYYALQLRSLINAGFVVARSWSASLRRKVLGYVDEYLIGLEVLLRDLCKQSDLLPTERVEQLDAAYDAQVRESLAAHDAWVGKRWMLIPRRAGGSISVVGEEDLKDGDANEILLQLGLFLIQELTRRIQGSTDVTTRASLMEVIQRLSSLGSASGGTAAKTRAALRGMRAELMHPLIRDIWSVPLAAVDPAANSFRELAFSYQ